LAESRFSLPSGAATRHRTKFFGRAFARLSLACAVAVVVTAGGQVGQSASVNNLTTMYIGDVDWFKNYDFHDQSLPVSDQNVDWPVDILFWNNANEGIIVTDFVNYGYTTAFTSTEYLRFSDGAPRDAQFDSDGGVKTGCYPVGSDNHFRLYSDFDWQNYNIEWGYYVLATSHQDHNECGPVGRWFGKSELAENYITSDARAIYGNGAVADDLFNVHNYQPYREEGNHIWDNDKWMTTVFIQY
jgi:hypothetical protein